MMNLFSRSDSSRTICIGIVGAALCALPGCFLDTDVWDSSLCAPKNEIFRHPGTTATLSRGTLTTLACAQKSLGILYRKPLPAECGWNIESAGEDQYQVVVRCNRSAPFSGS